MSAADEVRACETAHHMQYQSQKAEDSARDQITFSYCSWPPAVYAQTDGYSAIIVSTRPGPEETESSDADSADYINATCPLLRLQYEFGSQGSYQQLPSFTIQVGIVTWEDHPGERWTGPAPYPYPTGDQVVYLHNSNQVVDAARCA